MDFLRFLTTLDGKMWLTLKTLFLLPGELTLAFERGQHAKYIVPWRLVFLTVVITFLVSAILPDIAERNNSKNTPRFGFFTQNAVLHEAYERMDSIAQTQPDSVRRHIQTAMTVLDTINHIGKISRDSFWCLGPANGYNLFWYSDTIMVAKHDFFMLQNDALREKYNLTWLQIRAVNSSFANDGDRDRQTTQLYEKNFSWILLAHAVLFASLMALFYRRKVWQMHFVFNLHTACFFTLSSLLMELFPWSASVQWSIYVVILLVYGWYSYRRFYQPKGWRRYTGFAAYTIGYLSVFILMLGMIFLIWGRLA